MLKGALVLMTSKKEKKVYALQFKLKDGFQENLDQVISFVQRCVKYSVICTADLSLSGFALDCLEEASEFYRYALDRLLEHTEDKTLITSVIEKEDGVFYNSIKVIKNSKIIYSQSKTRAFPGVNEDDYMSFRDIKQIQFFDIDGIKCAALNCYELRYVELWEKIKGAEIVFVLAQWDKDYKKHFEVLTQALAITNQCYVVASDYANVEKSKSSSIITPNGEVYKDGKKGIIYATINTDEVWKFRNTLKTGLERC